MQDKMDHVVHIELVPLRFYPLSLKYFLLICSYFQEIKRLGHSTG